MTYFFIININHSVCVWWVLFVCLIFFLWGGCVIFFFFYTDSHNFRLFWTFHCCTYVWLCIIRPFSLHCTVVWISFSSEIHGIYWLKCMYVLLPRALAIGCFCCLFLWLNLELLKKNNLGPACDYTRREDSVLKESELSAEEYTRSR